MKLSNNDIKIMHKILSKLNEKHIGTWIRYAWKECGSLTKAVDLLAKEISPFSSQPKVVLKSLCRLICVLDNGKVELGAYSIEWRRVDDESSDKEYKID